MTGKGELRRDLIVTWTERMIGQHETLYGQSSYQAENHNIDSAAPSSPNIENSAWETASQVIGRKPFLPGIEPILVADADVRLASPKYLWCPLYDNLPIQPHPTPHHSSIWGLSGQRSIQKYNSTGAKPNLAGVKNGQHSEDKAALPMQHSWNVSKSAVYRLGGRWNCSWL